ncbi:DUF2252 family protein [Streptomyces sp. NPDC039022]|uniref:DUF2252 family protein n=1 Tax=unclassified Streptomyces TaxID=2593676 RepID=UPI0033E8CD14
MTRLPYVTGFAKPDARGPAPKAVGKALRERAPRSAHGRFTPDAGRPDAVTTVEESNTGRLPELVPIRVGRMAAGPFAFLRGTAGLMAYDLMTTPVTGIGAQICGDAHAANFGLYGDARGKLVMDLNDFDETLYGPWEWDLKRLVASLVLAGREAGASEEQCREAARDAVGAYRRTMRLLAGMSAADAWHAIADEELVSHTDARDLLGTLERVVAKARKNTSARFAAKATEEISGGGRRFVDAPPVLRRIPDAEAAAVASSLAGYLDTLPEHRLPLLARYEVQDVAFRVVGTGSVGLRSYVVLLLDHRGEPLVLQVKEARSSALTPYAEKAGFPASAVAHEGRRIVRGQRHMQVVSDSLLGWTTVYEPHAGSGESGGDAGEQAGRGRERGRGRGRGEEWAEGPGEAWGEGHGEAWGEGRNGAWGAGRGGTGCAKRGVTWGARPGRAWGEGLGEGEGETSARWRAEGWAGARHEGRGGGRGEGAGRPYQVRQFRNRKGSVDPTALAGDQIDDYARMTGALLARAHAHSADPRVVAGYCGKGEALDEALADFAVVYADRTEADHAELVAAIRKGRIAAETGV